MASIIERLKDGWSAFTGRDPTTHVNLGPSYSTRASHFTTYRGDTTSIKSVVIMKMANDVSMLDFNHIMTDEDGGYLEKIDDELNDRLTLMANIDQTAKEFIREAITTMLEDGSVGIMPVASYPNFLTSEYYAIDQWRCCKILEYYPDHVKVEVWNDRKSTRQQYVLPKTKVARLTNPFYDVMNKPNFALNALSRKMGLDSALDSQIGSNKLDIIIQLPYSTSNDKRKGIAEERRNDINQQLSNSKYGIAYMDVNEKIIQLNRPIENQTQSAIEYYEKRFYTMTGLTEGVINGTANPEEMNNYYNRCTRVLAVAFADAIKMAFLSYEQIKDGESIRYFRNPFESVTINNLPDLVDKLGRAEVISPNEVRRELGLKPAADSQADELRNRNISKPNDGTESPNVGSEEVEGNVPEEPVE